MKVDVPSARVSTPATEGTFRVPIRKILPAIGSAIRDLLAQRGWFSAPRREGAAALLEALGEVAETLETGTSSSRRDALLAKIPLSRTLTHRSWELPYELPPTMHVGTAGAPVDLSTLDPKQTYLWVLDGDGRFLVAAERQDGVDGKVNHGDMCPAADGGARGAARAGGELKARRAEDGRVVWDLDLSSSFSFNRMDLDVLRDEHLHAVIAFLKADGMDVSNLGLGRNTFDAIYRLAGFGHLAKYYMGIGAPR